MRRKEEGVPQSILRSALSVLPIGISSELEDQSGSVGVAQSGGVVQRGTAVVVHMVGLRSAQIYQHFHASRVTSGSGAMEGCQAVLVRGASGRCSSSPACSHCTSKYITYIYIYTHGLAREKGRARSIFPIATSPEPAQPPHYRRSPPTESAAAHPRPLRSRPRQIPRASGGP